MSSLSRIGRACRRRTTSSSDPPGNKARRQFDRKHDGVDAENGPQRRTLALSQCVNRARLVFATICHPEILPRQSPEPLSAARVVRYLHRRTLYAAIGTKHATVAGLGLEHLAASRTLVEPLARVGGHRFLCLMPALRTGERGFERDACHVQFPLLT